MPTSPTAEQQAQAQTLPDVLPVLCSEDVVVFPYIICPISIGHDENLAIIDAALGEDRTLLLVPAKKEEDGSTPTAVGRVGTAITIMRMLKLPDGRTRILVQGLARARVRHLATTRGVPRARIEAIPEAEPHARLDAEALIRSTRDGLEKAVQLGKPISSEVMVIASNVTDAGRLADLAASSLELDFEKSVEILQIVDPYERLRHVHDLLLREVTLLELQHQISSQTREEMDRNQREYFLRQQLRSIQDELGETDDLAEEVATYRRRALEHGLSVEANDELGRQLRRLERSHPDSAESAVIRSYLDWLSGMPWSKLSEDDLDLDRARKILDEDHFGLEEAKERILEFLAVLKLKRDARGPLLCFVGPPGVGKTSLGRSIARALGRKFVHVALGGVRDEAEIRGHRRTYVGALPGRILQALHQAGTSNPVFVLDEIDKIGSDFRGDPASALLEVLDPEQNNSFRDHYLGVEYDLSKVLFLATANLTDPIPPAFLDRLEILRLPGYTVEEKLQIARRHLVPKQLDNNGLAPGAVRFVGEALTRVATEYTRESGVRNLEREIGSICRKAALERARGRTRNWRVDALRVQKLLGPPTHRAERLLLADRIGVATGLAWTATGGDLLVIEANAVPGKRMLHLTGRLGDVMKESAQAALSYVQGFAAGYGVEPSFFANNEIHIHAPAGAVPKDGPSAGVTIATALASLVLGRPVDCTIAMTGEVTLRGEVLAVGGLREKLYAAMQAGARTVLVPRDNEPDLVRVSPLVKAKVELRLVATVDEVLRIALRLEPMATPADRSPEQRAGAP